MKFTANIQRNFLSLILLPLVTGCTSQKLEDSVKLVERHISELRRNQADHVSRISLLESEVRNLNGKLEELEYSQQKKLGTDITTLRQDLSNIRRKLPPPAIVPASVLEADELSALRLPASIGQQYIETLTRIRGGEFSLAKSHLEELLILTEGTEQEVFMLFWQSIVMEGLGDNRKALEGYLLASSKYPKHSRIPLVMLRQAEVLLKLGDKKSAQVTLKKLINDFPRSDEAMRARDQLKKL